VCQVTIELITEMNREGDVVILREFYGKAALADKA